MFIPCIAFLISFSCLNSLGVHPRVFSFVFYFFNIFMLIPLDSSFEIKVTLFGDPCCGTGSSLWKHVVFVFHVACVLGARPFVRFVGLGVSICFCLPAFDRSVCNG